MRGINGHSGAAVAGRAFQVSNAPHSGDEGVAHFEFRRANGLDGLYPYGDSTTFWRNLAPVDLTGVGDPRDPINYTFTIIGAALDDAATHATNIAAEVEDTASVSFRLLGNDPGEGGWPTWLETSAGVPFVDASCGGGPIFKVPDYNNVNFLTWYEHMVHGFFAYLRTHPRRDRVAYVDIGGAITLGEFNWQNCELSGGGSLPFPTLATMQTIVDFFMDAARPVSGRQFELLISMDVVNVDASIMNYVFNHPKGGGGWRQDGFGSCGQFNRYQNIIESDSVRSNNYQNHPVHFEIWQADLDDWTTDPDVGYLPNGDTFPGDCQLSSVDISNVSDIFALGFDGRFRANTLNQFAAPVTDPNIIANYDPTLQKMGQQLAVSQIDQPGTVAASANYNMTYTILNTGTSPNYNTYFSWVLKVDVGGVVSSATVPQIQPGDTADVVINAVAPAVPGNYTPEFYVERIGEVETFNFELMNTGDTGTHPDHRYPSPSSITIT